MLRCESGDHRGEARAVGPLISWGPAGDGVAELFELVDESAGSVFGGASSLGAVRAEVGVVDFVVAAPRGGARGGMGATPACRSRSGRVSPGAPSAVVRRVRRGGDRVVLD